jgi:hypothetical protein
MVSLELPDQETDHVIERAFKNQVCFVLHARCRMQMAFIEFPTGQLKYVQYSKQLEYL